MAFFVYRTVFLRLSYSCFLFLFRFSEVSLWAFLVVPLVSYGFRMIVLAFLWFSEFVRWFVMVVFCFPDGCLDFSRAVSYGFLCVSHSFFIVPLGFC